MVAADGDEQVEEWVESGVKNRFALITFPALVDADTGKVRGVRKIRAWGMFYDAFLCDIVRQHVGESEKLAVSASEKRSALGKILVISAAFGVLAMAVMVGWLFSIVFHMR